MVMQKVTLTLRMSTAVTIVVDMKFCAGRVFHGGNRDRALQSSCDFHCGKLGRSV